jgi:hypothetical protein
MLTSARHWKLIRRSVSKPPIGSVSLCTYTAQRAHWSHTLATTAIPVVSSLAQLKARSLFTQTPRANVPSPRSCPRPLPLFSPSWSAIPSAPTIASKPIAQPKPSIWRRQQAFRPTPLWLVGRARRNHCWGDVGMRVKRRDRRCGGICGLVCFGKRQRERQPS